MIVKFCGITNIDDALAALDAGADWIGLNLVSGPRCIDLATVEAIMNHLGNPACAVVLLRIDTPPAAASPKLDDATMHCTDALEHMLDILSPLGVRRLQLYGHVSPDTLAELRGRGFETIVVHHVRNAASLTHSLEAARRASQGGSSVNATDQKPANNLSPSSKTAPGVSPDYVLLDSADATRLGGTGRRADWKAIATARRARRGVSWPPWILAGGLTPDNVAEAVQMLHPDGVDVSSGIERAPGHKDPDKMRRFVESVRSASTHSDGA